MNQTLLIGDGDTELCKLYRLFFATYGYEVEIARDGLECLEKLRRLKPLALVLDLELKWGGSDGLLAWLREEKIAPPIPVILTATAGYLQDLAEFVEPPIVDYLSKPFPLTFLLELVRSAVAVNKPLAEYC